MSSHDPSGPVQEPEYLGTGESPTASPGRRAGRRTAVLGAAAVAVVGAVGLGGWAALSLMSGGSSAATAVPANALGYVSLDLDPSASQKIEAFRIMRKFPGLEKQLDLGSRDDIRKWVFTEIQKDGSCKGLDYDADIAPWIGDRIAMAAVPAVNGGKPLVMGALQVTDQEAAAKGLQRLADCSGEDSGSHPFAFAGDYAVISDSAKHAESLAARAEQGALADDAGFQKWTEQAGDPGIVTMYASAGAPDAMFDLAKQDSSSWVGTGDDVVSGKLENQSMLAQMDRMKSVYKSFKGAAGVLRFRDGAVEAEFAGGGMDSYVGSGASGTDVTRLPGSTAAAVSVALRGGWLEDYLSSMSAMLGDGASVDELMKQGEAATGLRLPEDIETMLGDGVSISLDSSADFASLNRNPDPTQIPAGVLIKGDPAEITPIIDKLKAAMGPEARMVVVRTGDGVVGLGPDRDYVGKLVAGGTLGDDPSFQAAVPEADRANSVVYVGFDAGNRWAERLADLASDGDEKVTQNIAPLDSLGISSWTGSDKVQHGLMRLTTD